jgi:molecular chaperone GrpE
MRKKEHNDSKPSKADLLIEEAVRAVDKTEEAHEEIKEKEGISKDSGAIAKIDLQQFVEKEAYLRLAADFENFRRRAVKERQDSEKAGKEKILRGFLDILDNLDRGLGQASGETSPLADGIRMVLSQVDSWLKAEGLSRIECEGRVFDPAVHEAVAQEESASHAAGTILREVRRGYRWSDRLLRPAAVIVSKGSGRVESAPSEEN